MSVRTPIGTFHGEAEAIGAILQEFFKARSSIRDVADSGDLSNIYVPRSHREILIERNDGEDPFTDAEWERIADLNLTPPNLVRLASEDIHTRRKTLALMDLSEDQLREYQAAGLMASGQRRTKAEMTAFRVTLYQLLQGDNPMTVRQVFYQMVGRGLEKTEAQYQRVQQELVHMRRGERLPKVPHGWIADATRWQRKPTTYTGLEEALERTARTYRRDLWANQPVYVEIWLEKDALAGVLVDVTGRWDVPLMVSRGFSSVSFLYEAAEDIKSLGKPAHIYIFTDRDRSGDDIARSIEASLTDLAPDADITCHRAAVTAEQVEELELPTRPPKRKGDPPAVELDAIPAHKLRAIAERCITRHIDPGVLERVRAEEEAERETLEKVMESFGDAA